MFGLVFRVAYLHLLAMRGLHYTTCYVGRGRWTGGRHMGVNRTLGLSCILPGPTPAGPWYRSGVVADSRDDPVQSGNW